MRVFDRTLSQSVKSYTSLPSNPQEVLPTLSTARCLSFPLLPVTYPQMHKDQQQQQNVHMKEQPSTRMGDTCEFTTTQEHLARALRTVSGVVGRNPTLPILGNVLLKSARGQLQISTTDLEVGITAWVTGRMRGEGSVTIPFRTLSEYLQHLPLGSVTLQIKPGALVITAQDAEGKKTKAAHAVLQGESAENFPLIPSLESGHDLVLPSREAARGLEKVLYAVATDDTRPELAGVYAHGEGNTLIFAATDSYRLAEARLTLPKALPAPVSVIIPGRAATEMRRILESVDEAVLRVGEGQLLLQTPSAHLVSRRVEGTYPDYTQVLPQQSPTTVDVDRADLLRSIRAAAVFSEHTVSRVTLEVGDDQLRVTAVTPEVGETDNALPADVHGEKVTISFNARFLRDTLSVLVGERIRIGLGNATTPAVFRVLTTPVSKSPKSHGEAEQPTLETLGLIMPIRA
ncbi:MAG: DNA polymerase III subunit beta [Parcubacteria group bacterium Gr01-1014_106]|nr:MAG: DNA polymerase III subunit beta [Parcubacteria group bacterium Gr01-1014_106]